MIKNKIGISLIEIMVMIAVIGLLVAIAVPNFIRARRIALAREKGITVEEFIILQKNERKSRKIEKKYKEPISEFNKATKRL